jgi:transcriptional regulator with XRE-family HTH domain
MTKAEETLNRDMGERLRAARNARGLSLSELAELTGGQYSKPRISNYEQGIRRMSVEVALGLAEALGSVSAAHLLCLDNEKGAFGEDELRLLEAFRRADAAGRRQLLETAERIVGGAG